MKLTVPNFRASLACNLLASPRLEGGTALHSWRLAIFSLLGILLLGATSETTAVATYVQGAAGTANAGTSVSATYTGAQGAGNVNVVFVGWNNSTSSVQSISDTNGNTYLTAIGPSVSPGNATQVMYYAKNIVGSPAGANAVTVTFNGSVPFPDVRILEYSGINSTNPIDVTVSSYGSGTSLNSGSINTTTANDLLVASGYVQHSYTGGAGSGYTQVLVSAWNLVEDAMVSQVGAYSATSSDTSGYWVMQLVAFRAAASSTDTVPPTAPAALIATSASSTQTNLLWTASTDNVGVTGYLIERCRGSGCTNFAQVGSSSTTTYVDSGLSAATPYTYRIRASDAVGNLSGYSNTAGDTTTPSTAGPAYVQGNFVTSNGVSSINVTFAAAQQAGDVNVVFVGWNDTASTVQSIRDSSGNNYTVAVGPTTNPGNATQVVYYAKNIVGAAAGANAVTINFSGLVSYPDVRVLELTGADPTNPLDVVTGANGNGTTLNSGPLTTTAANDLLVASGYVQHSYTGGAGSGYTELFVSAWNLVEDEFAAAAGTYSATSSDVSGYWVMQLVAFRAVAYVPDTLPPTEPSSFTATTASSSEVDLSWAASSDNVHVVGYLIERATCGVSPSFVQIATATAASFSDTGLAASTCYIYQVEAIDEAGNVSLTATQTVTTDNSAGTEPSTYFYDSHGRLQSVVTPGANTIHYYYDAAGHLINIQATTP